MTERLDRSQVAWRIAQDIPDGSYVNLGIGQPELVANYLPLGVEIILHSENGILGMGPDPGPNERDFDLVNAGKKPVTLLPGGSFFHHADSFAIVRGGRLDLCVLGAYQVGANGDLANWSTGAADAIPAVGGAMDIAVGAKRCVVMTEHTTRDGAAKLVAACTYPLTAVGVVKTVYSDLAVVDLDADGFVVREIAPGVTIEELRAKTGAALRVAPTCGTIGAPSL